MLQRAGHDSARGAAGLNVRTKVGRRRKLSGSMVLWATEGEQMWTPLRREEVLADSGITARSCPPPPLAHAARAHRPYLTRPAAP